MPWVSRMSLRGVRETATGALPAARPSGVHRDASVAWFVLLGCRRRRGTLPRNPQRDRGAAAGKVLCGYGAAMRLHDGLDDRETHAGAASRGSTVEALEDVGQILVRDTKPVVTHLDDDALPIWVCSELDPSAFFGVADGVLHQAVECRLQTRAIGHHNRRDRAQPPVAIRGGPPAWHGPLQQRTTRS